MYLLGGGGGGCATEVVVRAASWLFLGMTLPVLAWTPVRTLGATGTFLQIFIVISSALLVTGKIKGIT